MENVVINVVGSLTRWGQTEETEFFTRGTVEMQDEQTVLSYLGTGGEDDRMEITLSGKEVTLKKPESRTGDAAIVVLREKQAYSSFYQTPVGVVAVQVYPTLVHVQKEAEQGKIELEYITSIADTQAVNRLRVEYARRYRDIQNRKREGENDGH
ncbi:MAG: DUF1934 domain-containing protein [Christensenellaceae bacterium]